MERKHLTDGKGASLGLNSVRPTTYSKMYSAKNEYLRNLAILIRAKQEISDLCLQEYDLKIAPLKEKRSEERLKRIEGLKKMGLISRDNDMSFYLNRLSLSCHYCKMGFGPTLHYTNDCTRDCFFCFQRRVDIAQKMDNGLPSLEIDNEIRFLADNKYPANIINLGISGGEPLLVLEKVIRSIKVTKQRKDALSLTRLYTNGDLLNEEKLIKLKNSGLDEIRFGIKFGDFKILEKVILAKKYIPRVLVEGPVLPESEKFFKELMSELNRIKIFGINLLDLRCRFNIAAYKKRKYSFEYKEKEPFYEQWYQGWPVYGSEKIIFNLLEFAIRKKFTMSVHYCPVKQNVKVTSLNSRALLAFAKSKPYEIVTKDGLLRKAVVYYPDNLKAARDLRKSGVPKKEINMLPDSLRLETHVDNVKFLNLSEYEVGILDALPDQEEAGIKIISSSGLKNYSTRKRNKCLSKPFLFMHIGEHIASAYFRKKSENSYGAKKALNIIERKLNILPNQPAFSLAASRIFYYIKEYGKAIKTIKKIINLGYRKYEVYLLLGLCYGKSGQYKKAIKEFRQAERLSLKEPNINFIIAKYLSKIGQEEKAHNELVVGVIKSKSK